MQIKGYIITTSLYSGQNILESIPAGCSDTEIFGDTIGDKHGNKYNVGISSDKREFVLRTKIEDESYLTNISKENEDLDGDVFGCDCNDPYYCFKTDLFSQLENK